MSERRTVAWAEGLVSELESLTPAQWRRVQGHASYVDFCDLYLTAKCLTDFWWHLRMGVYFNDWKHYDPVHHRKVAYWLQDWTRERHGVKELVKVKAAIHSRELCKTQLASIAYPSWCFARDPNIRMMIVSYVDPLAYQISGALMKLLKSPAYTRRYPWVRPMLRDGSTQEYRWTPKEFFLDREQGHVRVPSCQAMGIDGTPTGSHFHLVVYDDFEVRENATSDTLRPGLFTRFSDDDNVCMAGSQRIIAGTPWDPRAFIQGILSYKNGMEDHAIDVYRAPCCVEVFERPFTGHEPVLLEDRCTIRQLSAGFPTAMETLATCGVTVRFFSELAGDVVEETREVVWNDATHFRVNRPFGAMLGQPVSFVVGTEKPVSPIRYTLDSVDWVPELGAELPPAVAAHASAPGVDTLNPRSSLPEKLKMQGSLIFNAQMRLMSTDETALVLRSSDIRVISWSDVPEGARRWRRSWDYASAKKTAAASSGTTGFEIDGFGFVIAHISYEPQMDTTWKLLELVWGVKRVSNWGGRLELTTFEKSGHIEEVVKDLLPDVLRDPHAYFSRFGGRRPSPELPTYQELADSYFAPGERVSVPIKWIPRTQSKNDRIAKQQPVWQSGKLYILDECPHRETLYDQADRFTLATEDPFDLLDNLADLLAEGRLLKTLSPPAKSRYTGEDEYGAGLKEARLAMLQQSGAGLAPGWPA